MSVNPMQFLKDRHSREEADRRRIMLVVVSVVMEGLFLYEHKQLN